MYPPRCTRALPKFPIAPLTSTGSVVLPEHRHRTKKNGWTSRRLGGLAWHGSAGCGLVWLDVVGWRGRPHGRPLRFIYNLSCSDTARMGILGRSTPPPVPLDYDEAMSRADRRNRTKRVVQRRVQQVLVLGWGAGDPDPDGRILGRWRRHSPGDCGRSRCGLCSGPSYRHERRRWKQRNRAPADAQPC